VVKVMTCDACGALRPPEQSIELPSNPLCVSWMCKGPCQEKPPPTRSERKHQRRPEELRWQIDGHIRQPPDR